MLFSAVNSCIFFNLSLCRLFDSCYFRPWVDVFVLFVSEELDYLPIDPFQFIYISLFFFEFH